MRKLKHLKLRNSAIIYETLLRQITIDTLEGNVGSAVFDILKEFFGKGKLLSEELGLYNSIVEYKTKDENKLEYFLDTVINMRKRLNESQLAQEKYNVIKEIKKHYSIDTLFNSKVENYKILASIYKLFEAELYPKNNYNPTEIVQTKYTIIEHVTNKITKSEKTEIDLMVEKYKSQDKEIRVIAYNMLIEKFNKKYAILNDAQKCLLKTYIDSMSNVTALKEYIEKEVPRVTELLEGYIPEIDSEVITIKLTELLKHTESLVRGNRVKDAQITNLMKLYELENEISNVIANSDSIPFVQHNDWNTAILKKEEDYKAFKKALGVTGIKEDLGYETITNSYCVNYSVGEARRIFGVNYAKIMEDSFNIMPGIKRRYAI